MRNYILKPFPPRHEVAAPQSSHWGYPQRDVSQGGGVLKNEGKVGTIAPSLTQRLPCRANYKPVSLFQKELSYLMKKTEVAFIMTCEKLFTEYKKLYFWTFTFVDVHHDWQYSRLWSEIIRDIANHFGGDVYGVKVIEAHKSHGLHYHAILTVRLPVEVIRRVGAKYGLGRIHVTKCDAGAACYLTKYLTEDKTVLYPGIARWGTVGGYVGTKVRDIVIESNGTRACFELTKRCGKLPFRVAMLTYTYGTMFGDKIKQWDFKTQRLYETQLCAMLRVEQKQLYRRIRGVLYDDTNCPMSDRRDEGHVVLRQDQLDEALDRDDPF